MKQTPRDFFSPAPFSRYLSLALTVLLGNLQAHDWHEGQKPRAQVCLARWGKWTDWRKEGSKQKFFGPSDVQAHVQCAMLISNGLLRDPRFGQILIAKPNLKRLVLNDGTLDFPRTTHQARLEQSEEFLGIEEIGDISAAFQSLCTYIALPWTPQGSEALMEQQLQEISLRLGDVEVDSCFLPLSF